MSCRIKMHYMHYLCVAIPAAVAGIVLCQAASVQAVPLGSPNAGNGWSTTSAVSIASHSGEAGGRVIMDIISGAGISGANGEFHVGGNPFGTMGLFRGDNLGPTPSSADPGTVLGSHWVKFQFDQVYSLGETWLWNWNETPFNAFGWKDLTVQYSADGSTWNTGFIGQVPIAPGADGALPQLVFDFGGASAQYVVLTNTGFGNDENWSGGQFTNDAGLSEVRFFTAVVPEPATFAVLLVGLGFLLPFVRTRARSRK